ncbi:hypothetical protein LOTGIDRAFT_172803 [Lottia gigantea]|uniref:Uncharacterized protein n=1 Tax=Lottia gigantea TaxID=225164 RepID=V4CG78_LOTGI|nr:hypothetical protein LOTGIDRAFT_172803 [Lottia gigantea]ESP01070.1 hypothetical protein LOTGIDRAFT_172803 [Lottia gigantea]
MDGDDEYNVQISEQLLQAVDEDNEATVRDLLSKNAYIKSSGELNQIAINLAVKKQNIPIVKLLLDHGCDVNASTVDGDTAFINSLHHYLKGNRAITKLLLPYCNCIKLADALETRDQIPDLCFINFIQSLIKHRADFLTNNNNNKLQLVKLLLANDKLRLVCTFIDAGLCINSVTAHDENIYHLLAKYCEDDKVDYTDLIFHKIDLHHRNKDQNTPLMIASFLHNRSFIMCCIEESVRHLDIQNGEGHTALHLCIIGFAGIIKKLSKYKCEKYRKELCDFNYLPNFMHCVDILLKAGIKINTQDISGKTALMWAVMTNNKILVDKLLKAKADSRLLDCKGRSAIQYFNFMDYTDDLACFKLLYEYDGNRGLNLPQINGQTIIQNMLTFSELWNMDQRLLFIKFLIGRNISLHELNSSEYYVSYISLKDFSSKERMKLREILYISGAPHSEITTSLNFDIEEEAMKNYNRGGPRQAFAIFCNNMSLEKLCRRFIRQRSGSNIQEVATFLGVPHISDFLLLNDCPEYEIPHSLDYDRFLHNQTSHDYVNYNLYDFDCQTDGDSKLYDHIQYLNENSFYNFS